MGSHMRSLQGEDPQRMLVARRCHTLGFDSAEILTSHFSQFGRVSKVLVAHSKVRPRRDCVHSARTRPGSIAFVLMADAAAIEGIWQSGGVQMVAGRWISIEPFSALQPPSSGSPSPGSTRARDLVESVCSFGSHLSARSTRCSTDTIAPCGSTDQEEPEEPVRPNL
ncbi:unnamed protein product [Prorocentrum cordatum]|uniref:RRM domain-containing protein n=1 Tax=Prorocentrum cordatum TaxID=2364126 RepID=A0ABN9SRP3_9DINO|nr:unnamed protein product [Polarella glacialis]